MSKNLNLTGIKTILINYHSTSVNNQILLWTSVFNAFKCKTFLIFYLSSLVKRNCIVHATHLSKLVGRVHITKYVFFRTWFHINDYFQWYKIIIEFLLYGSSNGKKRLLRAVCWGALCEICSCKFNKCSYFESIQIQGLPRISI